MSRIPVVPGYQLVDRVHRGPGADVWRATRTADGRPVAVKIPAPGPDGADVGAESALLARARHPNLLALLDTVELDDARRCLVTDLADGGSLADLVEARAGLTQGEAAALLAPVADAVWSLHRAGLVHGDLSPDNILLTSSGRPLVADLGAARHRGGHEQAWGTEGFVAPEVLTGHPRAAESDVFAIGALLAYALSGSGVAALEPPERVAARCAERGAGDDLTAVLERMLDGEPGRRPRAIDVAKELTALGLDEPVEVGGRSEKDLVTQRVRASARDALAAATPTTRAAARAREVRSPVSRWLADHGGPARLATVAVLLALLFAGTFGLTRLLTGGAGTGPVASSSSSQPAAGTVPSTEQAAAKNPSGAASSSAPAGAGPSVDPAVAQGAAATRPAAVLQSLLTRRARALESTDVAALRHVDAPSSWAHERDKAIVDELARRGERPRGVRFSVGSARVVSASASRTLVEASVGLDGYSWTRPTGSGTAGRRDAAAARYTLVWFDGRWLIERVDPA